ncbi:MDR family MFS transporter [Enterococcus hermanniensis]|uniref:Drug:H+ antiporter-2 (14 Spanner) (DHA2) family drug resistance MFS transporter n=1 Tax=Enterococcus hermanniensis TaxID=249189 RepID=A0A1L8TSN1_9ENTE|nr:MDR family MFS transporter [Enterococcus hermanniensis]OJG47188.1 drug:H+ antiporter-2 (14 Spanner) (DHA2) family drug resistance MFS transporter [Enterococcus hermanniensis]
MKRTTNVKVVTVGIFIATFMSAIEGTIVTTAMPTIVGSLQGIEIMNWVFSIYLLTSAMITPIYGKLADKIGRKPIFFIGILLFVLGSTLCGFSNEMLTLIIARGIQGLGAGAIMPVSLTIIADLYDIDKRAKVLGLTSAAWGIASVFGPLAGGLIVDTVGWHWIFFINVPIGLGLIGLLQYFFIEEKRDYQAKKMDVLGSLFLMLTLLSLLLGFQLLGDEGLSISVVGLFIFSLVALFLFVQTEKRADDPVIDLNLFSNQTFASVNIVAALISGFLMSLDVYIPMWMQGVLEKSAGLGGLVLAPLSIVWMYGSFLSGRLLLKYSAKRIIVLGLFIILIGGGSLLFLPQASPFWLFFVIMGILGVGYGLAVTTTTVEAQASVSQTEIGVATSFNTLSRTIGQTIMVSVFGIILNISNGRQLAQAGIEDTTLMNRLINPHTALQIEQTLRNELRTILFNSLHWIYLAGLLLIIIALLFSVLFGKQSKRVKLNKQ